MAAIYHHIKTRVSWMKFRLGGHRTWERQLKEAIHAMNSLSKETESEFLAIGSRLNEFFGLCSQNLSRASDIIRMIESGDGLNIDAFRKSFDHAYDQVGSASERIENVLNGLEELNVKMASVTTLTEILEKLCHSIRFLGVSMKIEIARVGKHDFYAVAESVENLYRQIIQYIDAIYSTTRQATQQITEIGKESLRHLNTFNSELDSSRHSVQHIINELSNATLDTRKHCKNIQKLASRITPEMSEVVTALQYHDISRQQVEHVSQAFEEIVARLGDALHARKKEKTLFYYWMSKVVELQIIQIEHVLGETDQTANKISSHLAVISEVATSQSMEADHILRMANSSTERVEVTDNQLKTLLKTLSSSKDITTRIVGSIGIVSKQVGLVAEQVANIEEIQEDLDDLTLNAVIKAIRAGEEGKVLSVLSENIRRLSNSAQKELNEKTIAINEILHSFAQYERDLTEKLNQQLQTTDKTYQRTRKAVQKIINDDETVMQSMVEVSNISKRLETEIASVIASVQFDKVMRTKLQAIIRSLKVIHDQVGKLVPGGLEDEYSQLDQDLEELAQRYTMHSQREIHQKFLAQRNARKKQNIKPVKAQAAEVSSLLIENGAKPSSDVYSMKHEDVEDVFLFGSDDDQQSTGDDDNIDLFDSEDQSNKVEDDDNVDLFDSTENPETTETQDTEPSAVSEDIGENVDLFDSASPATEPDQETPDAETAQSPTPKKQEKEATVDLGDNVDLF
ncbi:MAG: hypothetical protein HQM11_16600 [SAR324 cluster bacterium]|nr:hypothetical protein [SAR324 cluster bacterium]